MGNYWKKAAKENPDNPFIQGHAEAEPSEVSSTGLLSEAACSHFPKLESLKGYEVTWQDSSGVDSNWHDIDGWTPPSVTVSSIGVCTYQDDEVICITPHIARVDGERAQGCGEMTIPIRQVLIIEEHRDFQEIYNVYANKKE